MNKNRIRLTESQLHNVIKESVKQVLSELDWKTYDNAAQKAYHTKCKEPGIRDIDLYRKFKQAKADAFNKKYFDGEDEKSYFPNGGHFAQADFDSPPRVSGYTPGDMYDEYDVVGHASGPTIGLMSMEGQFDGVLKAFNGDEEKARNFINLCKEYHSHRTGKYEYQKGKGWQKKDGLDESIRKAIRKALH